MNEGINLLAPNKKNSSNAFLRRFDATRVLMVGLLFIVSVFSVILIILVAISPLPALQSQEESLKQTLFQSKSDIVKFELVNERLDTINSTLAKRPVFDEILGLLQSKLSNDSKITAIKIDKTNTTVTVESQSLQSINNFLNGLIGFVQEKKTFSNVTMTDLITNQTDNAYAVTVTLHLL